MKPASLRPSFKRRVLAGCLVAVAGVGATLACSANPDETSNGIGNTGATGQTGATGGTGSGSGSTGGSGGTIDPGVGGSANSGSGGSISVPDAGDGTCIRIGMLGRKPTYGAMDGVTDNTDALQIWLNDHVKAGTTADVVTVDTELNADFFAKYDVLVLQALEDKEGGPYWSFTQAELDAFQAWVRAGGGVITLMGYGALAAEVNPSNQLLAFTGMSYKTDDQYGTCPDDCCYCAFSSLPLKGWHADHPIAANITSVGAFHGRSVNPGDGAVVASEGANIWGATKEIDAGHVFVFFDEWVAYSSQWAGAPPNFPECVQTTHMCYGRTPGAGYQVPQFWYNALKWVSGNAGCFDFTDDVPIVR